MSATAEPEVVSGASRGFTEVVADAAVAADPVVRRRARPCEVRCLSRPAEEEVAVPQAAEIPAELLHVMLATSWLTATSVR